MLFLTVKNPPVAPGRPTSKALEKSGSYSKWSEVADAVIRARMVLLSIGV
jgi:hypothetical protein